MRKYYPEEFSFVPRTWVLPGEYNAVATTIQELRRRHRRKTFIVKPHNASMGNGITLARSLEDIPQSESVVVQEYVDKPFLLEGFKLDLRVYVLVTSCNPLRIFMYKDGLVRMSTQEYVPPTDSNLDQHYMHLTNYSINKHSEGFDHSQSVDKGSKRTLKYFFGWLREHDYNTVELWANIQDVVVKTLLMATPSLVHSYGACRPGHSGTAGKSQCFEILGFDILLDDDLRPWLLEVNRSPSFSTDSPLDWNIKSNLIREALQLADISASDRQRGASLHKAASRRRLLCTPSRPHCSRFDFAAEQEEALHDRERKKQEVKEQLMHIRREKEMEDHEEMHMSDFVRLLPSTDPVRARHYQALLQQSAKLSLSGRSSATSHQRGGVAPPKGTGLKRLKEHELLDLLSQYEEEGGANDTPPFCHVGFTDRPSTSSYQSVALQDSSPMDAVYAAMALREREEERCQRMMVALNETRASFPGHSCEEVEGVEGEVRAAMETHLPHIASFWLSSLNNSRRRQLLAPVREIAKKHFRLLWHTSVLQPIRLHRIVNLLFTFLLSHSGRGLWASVTLHGLTWDAHFKQSSEVISVTERACCRRIVELCNSAVLAAYRYHYLERGKKHSTASLARYPSLPSIRQSSSLTSRPSHPHSSHPHSSHPHSSHPHSSHPHSSHPHSSTFHSRSSTLIAYSPYRSTGARRKPSSLRE